MKLPIAISILTLWLFLSACTKDDPETVKAKKPCTMGIDNYCNEDRSAKDLHGTCNNDGTCTCLPGYQINPETGRCRK